MKFRALIAALALYGAVLAANEVEVVKDGAESGTLILNEQCCWRHFYERGMMRLSADALKKEKEPILNDTLLQRLEKDTRRHLERKNIDWSKTDWRDVAVVHFVRATPDDTEPMRLMESITPPADWKSFEFDDSSWVRFRLRPLAHQRSLEFFELFNRAAFLRTSFEVPDPQKAKDLTLQLTYRGGVRVFLNGQELARNHLPPGELGPEAKADDYPVDAYWAYIDEVPDQNLGRRCVADLRFNYNMAPKAPTKGPGKLENYRNAFAGSWVNQKGWERMMKLRDRELGPITIPVKLLRKGRNVLAVEIRGSHYNPIIVPQAGGERLTYQNWQSHGAVDNLSWAHTRLIRMELRDPAGVLPNMMIPFKAPQVRVEDMHTRCYTKDFSHSSEPVGTLRFVGAVNGTFSSQLVLSSGSQALAGIKATPSELKQIESGAVLPASALTISYMAAKPLKELIKLGTARGDNRSPVNYSSVDGVQYVSENPEILRSEPGPYLLSEMEKIQYFDHLTAAPPQTVPAASSQPIWVSLKIPVGTAPGIYKGEVQVEAQGMQSVIVPVEAEVIGWRIPSPQEFQNDIWLEQSPYGIAKHYKTPIWSEQHFKLIEASLKQAARAGNKTLWIPVIQRTEFGNVEDSMIKWIRANDGSLTFDYKNLDRYLDLAVKHMGKLKSISFGIMHSMMASAPPKVTVFDEATGKNEELGVSWKEDAFKRIPIWKSFATALHEHMRGKGLEKSIRWGHAGDPESDPALIALMWELFPEDYWTASPHSYKGGSGGGGHNQLVFRVVSEIYGEPYQAESRKGWKKEDESYFHPLCVRNFGGGICPPFFFRLLADKAIHMGYTGVGRIGFDYYDFSWKDGYIGSDWNAPGIPVFTMVYPGAEGAESSARYEAFVEGIQEAEARIFLEQCLNRNLLPVELAKEVLSIVYLNQRATSVDKFGESSLTYYTTGWQERSRKLFEIAAKVAHVVGLDVEKSAIQTSVPALGKTQLSIKMRNWTGQPRAWKASASEKWLVIEKLGGILSGQEDLNVTLDGTSLDADKEVTGTLTVTDAVSNLSFEVKIAVKVGKPMEVLFDHPHFNVHVGESETREFRVVNRASSEQTWSLASSVPWVKIEPASGTLAPGSFVFLKLTAGPPDKETALYNNTLSFSAAGGKGNFLLASKIFVVVPFQAPAALPMGRLVPIEKVEKKYVKEHGVLMHGGAAFSGLGYNGWGTSKEPPIFAASRRNGESSINLVLGKKTFYQALWVKPHHETVYNLEGSGFSSFSASVGIPTDVSKSSIRDFDRRISFELWVDGKQQAMSGMMTALDEPRLLVVTGLENAKELKLVTRLDSDGDNGTFVAVWADARFYVKE